MVKVVLITGAAGGIGSACARLFSETGWRVIGVDSAGETVPQCHSFISADVSGEEAWQAITRQVAEDYGRIHALVNNAAVQICKPLVQTSLEEWDLTMAVNLRSAYLSVRHLHPLLKAAGGSVVNVSSVHAVATSANMAAYAASKGALTALTRALAIELAGDGIRVNAVLPGAVDTAMLRAGLTRGHLAGADTASMMESLAQKTVLGRVGSASEIAQGVHFLADHEKSSFMTGQCLVVDGGATVRLSTE